MPVIKGAIICAAIALWGERQGDQKKEETGLTH